MRARDNVRAFLYDTALLTQDRVMMAATQLEETAEFTPRLNEHGLIACIVIDDTDGAVLMLAHMNAEALERTLASGEAWFWSRSRNKLWRKGETSGNAFSVVELRTDCDQDALLMKVRVGGNGVACHTGRRSCFYRRVPLRQSARPRRLEFEEAPRG